MPSLFTASFFCTGRWKELVVTLQNEALVETELLSSVETTPTFSLPAPASEGYVIDAPLATNVLADQIAAQPWTGLFVACDYGKSWRELSEHCPLGTARAYHRHTQSNHLLAQPGEQDLTCHICWDWLIATLARRGFSAPAVDSQEAFFVKYAERFMATDRHEGSLPIQSKKAGAASTPSPRPSGTKIPSPARPTRFCALTSWMRSSPVRGIKIPLASFFGQPLILTL